MSDFYIIIYFFVGVVQDFLLTLNFRYISEGKAVLASIFSFLVTVVSLAILYDILTRLDSERSVVAIIVYALGIATGTFIAMKVKKGFKS